MRDLLVLFSIIYFAAFLSGCSTFNAESFNASGAKASAACATGGPGGVLGIGPGGILSMAKVNEDFKGTVAISRDCSMGIQSN